MNYLLQMAVARGVNISPSAMPLGLGKGSQGATSGANATEVASAILATRKLVLHLRVSGGAPLQH
jgi:hypothetical protein